MSIIDTIRGLVTRKGPASRPPVGGLASQRQANQRPTDPGRNGTPYKVTHFQSAGRPEPKRGTQPTGTKQVKLPGARVFNQTNDDQTYLIPKGRPAATARGASNGSANTAPGAYLNGRKIKDVQTIKLDTLTTDFPVRTSGSVIVYADSTLGTDRVSIRFATSDGDQSGPLIPFRPGQFIGGERYSQALISWAAQAGSVATLVFVEDRPGDEFTYR